MEFCSCYPKAGCPGGKPQKTEFRGFFPRKILKKLSNINYINQITEIKFHKLQILEVCLLDNCILYQCWKFANIRLKLCKDIVCEILVIGLFDHFEKYGFKVFLQSLRAQISPMNGEGGGWLKEGGGRYVERFYINLSLNTRIHTRQRNVNASVNSSSANPPLGQTPGH